MIKASSVSIENLLGHNNESIEQKYCIPPYQRAYSWKKDQWDQLLADVQDNECGYFIGSILLIDKSNTQEEKIKTYEVIDGQQRLVTLSALLITIYYNLLIELAQKPTNDEGVFEFRLHIRNLIIGSRTNRIDRLTLSNQDKNFEHYNQILDEVIKLSNDNEINHENAIEKYFKYENYENKSTILEVIKHFNNEITKILSEVKPEKKIDQLLDLYTKIKLTKLVRIEVDDESSAYTIFESLNDRGTPLSPMDLIKNKIISEIIKTNEDDKITPELIDSKWNIITKSIKKSDEQFRFLKHYYYAFSNEKNTGNIKKITKSNVIKVYFEFIRKSKNKLDLLEDLISKSKIYFNILNPSNIDEKNEVNKKLLPYKETLIGINKVKAVPSHSLILYLLSQHEELNISKLIKFIELWFIRRHLENSPQTNKLDNIFLKIIVDLKNSTQVDLDKIILELSEYFSRTSKNEFIQKYKHIPMYKESKDATRVLLIRVEQKLSNLQQNTRNLWDKSWTIEHVLPQNLDSVNDNLDLIHWKSIYNEDIHSKWVHTIGNLTLSAHPYNAEMSRKIFKEKCLLKHDDISIGLINELSINKDFKSTYDKDEDWAPEKIIHRSENILTHFIELYDSFSSTSGSFFID